MAFRNEAQSEMIHSTGMESLDTRFETDGIYPGSIISIISEPAASGDTMALQIGRGTQSSIVSFAKKPTTITQHIDSIGLNTQNFTVRQVTEAAPLQQVRGMLQNTESQLVPENGVVMFTPVNILETANYTEYRDFLTDLSQVLEERNAIAVFHRMYDKETTVTRKPPEMLSEHFSDIVFSVYFTRNDYSMIERIRVDKVGYRHVFDSDANRVFRLEQGEGISISSKNQLTT